MNSINSGTTSTTFDCPFGGVDYIPGEQICDAEGTLWFCELTGWVEGYPCPFGCNVTSTDCAF